jgi:hypothetical protein
VGGGSVTAVVLALDVDTARAATDRLRLTLTDAHEQLIELWRGTAHEVLGYGAGVPGWTAYLAAEFGELLQVLPTPDQLAAMSDAGMPQRAIAAPFGVSLGKVNGLLAKRTPAPALEPVVDDRPTYARIADVVAAAGTRGLTIPQAVRRTGWTYGAVSGALSRAERRGLVTRPADLEQRGGFRPYTAPR